jgi:dynein heavy chain 1
MMVGPTGCGKSAAWKILLETLEKVDGKKGEAYVIDPKAINKDDLYGKLDSTTAEWTDGVFTMTLRNIIDNRRGEDKKNHWIIFDGDVDPEWAENLNSVLDDNKLLTLPSGERLSIPPNVKIMFEVESLKHATLATVSRCGMVWFSDTTVTLDMIYHHYLARLQQDDFDTLGEEETKKDEDGEKKEEPKLVVEQTAEVLQMRATRKTCVNAIKDMFVDNGFITKALNYAER